MLSNRLHHTLPPLTKTLNTTFFSLNSCDSGKPCDKITNRTHFRLKASIGMGRGKVELKRIEDKSSRQVSFSKRRNGLMKKSHELAVLCDVDVALFIFSGRGRLYEFSTGESMTRILSRYQSYKKTEELTRIALEQKLASEYGDVCTADDLTQMIQRHLDENNIKKLDINGFNQLERHLHNALRLVRLRKTQLLMGVVKGLQEQEMQLKKEKRIMMQEIEAARMNDMNIDSTNDAAVAEEHPWTDVQLTW